MSVKRVMQCLCKMQCNMLFIMRCGNYEREYALRLPSHAAVKYFIGRGGLSNLRWFVHCTGNMHGNNMFDFISCQESLSLRLVRNGRCENIEYNKQQNMMLLSLIRSLFFIMKFMF